MDHTILRNPTYLTVDEIKVLFQALEKTLTETYRKKNRFYKYTDLMLRAAVHMLFATGLRNAELRKLKPADIDMDNMKGVVLAKGSRNYNFTFNATARKKLIEFLAYKEKLF